MCHITRSPHFCLLLSFAVLEIGCADYTKRPAYVIVDKLESYVAIAFRSLPDTPPYKTPPAGAIPGEDVPVILKAVYCDDLAIPIANKRIDLQIINLSGESITTPTIAPASVTTSTTGYNIEPITLHCSNVGVFKIKAIYADKSSTSVSYSQPIIVLGTH